MNRSSLLTCALVPLAAIMFSSTLHAQGDWTPATANFTRPYTLTTAADMNGVRTRIVDPRLFPIYKALFDETYEAAIPGDTVTTDGRRARARMAKNLAFITHMGKPEGGVLGDFTKNEGSAIRQRLRDAMSGINPETGTALDYEEWQWRSKELIDYLIAYDLAVPLLGDGDLDEARIRLQEFAGNLHREATREALGFSFFANVKNNHALMTAAALGMAGVVLHDAVSDDYDRQPTTWIGAALFHIDNVMFNDPLRHMSERGVIAGYAEGPHYLRYAMLNVLPFFRALRNVLPDGEIAFSHDGNILALRHPFHDPDYHNLYEWIRRIRTPDGLMPSIEDTYVHEGFPELALLGNRTYYWPIESRYTTAAQQLNSTVDMRANYLASVVPDFPIVLDFISSFPEAGNLVFNTLDDDYPFYFGLLAEHGTALESGGGHDQADASSFMIMMGDEMMALDPGYVSYARRGEVGQATNHNMILVDGQGPEIGTPGEAGDAPATIEQAFHINDVIERRNSFGYGRITTSYQRANITRHVFFLHNRYAVVADWVAAINIEPHLYTWQLHGNGYAHGDESTGTFATGDEAKEVTWSRNGRYLTAHVITGSTGTARYSADTGIHESGYDQTDTHTVLRVRSQSTRSVGFVAGLLPDRADNPIDFESTFREGISTLISRVAGTHEIVSLGYDTTSRTLPAVDTDLPGEIQTDAPLVGFAIDPIDNEEPTLMFMHRGTDISYNGRQYLHTTMRTDVGIASDGAMTGNYSGYVGAAGTIAFVATSTGSIDDVVGESVESWEYLWATGMLRITFNGPGYFHTIWEGDVVIDPDPSASLVTVHATDDELRVRLLDERTDGITFRLSDLLGRTIATGSLDEEPIRHLSTKDLASGLYLLSIERNGVVEESRRISITR